MPLPADDAEWPPKRLRNVRMQMDEWDTWYSGDAERLHQLYERREWRPRPAQFAGGLAGVLARLWWGRPPTPGEPPEKLHIPIAADLASCSADLLFSEPPQFKVDSKETQKWLQENVVNDGLHSTLLAAADTQAALGGSYLRAVWDKEVAPLPWLARVDADGAVPEWRYDRLRAVTFWRVLENDGKEVWRHLERHEPGAIMHGLYVGHEDRDYNSANIGKRIDLSAHPETKGLTDVVRTNIKSRTAFYVPNVRPSRRWRKDPGFANLGRSDYEGIEPAMDRFDFVWSCWMRDIDLAKGRLIVPDGYLQSLGQGKGAVFDNDRRIFTPVDMMPNKDGTSQITIAQFAIRTDDHMRAVDKLLEQILRDAGYSAQTFGEVEGGTGTTATEIRANERRSLLTRSRKGLPYRPELAEASLALMELAREVANATVPPELPKVTLADSVQEDPLRLAQTAEALQAARAATTETRVRLVNPDWDDERVAKEVAGILKEQALENPDTFSRGGFDDDPEGEEQGRG